MVGPVYNPAEILDDPQVQALDMVTTVEDGLLGDIKMRNSLPASTQRRGPYVAPVGLSALTRIRS